MITLEAPGASDSLAAPARPVELSAAPRPAALYIHFPFCAHRCHYCDFSVKRARTPPVEAWLSRIGAEVAWWFARTGWRAPVPLDTLFVGGGTPSLLGAAGMEGLARSLEPWFAIDARRTEWTAEANPVSFDAELAAAWRAAGVNRVSLGVQSLDDRVLAWLGRLHDRTGAARAVEAAGRAGFERVSIDLMFGLPEGVERDLAREVDEVLGWGMGHISLYGLTIEPRTPLAQWVRLGRTNPCPDGRYAREYRDLAARLGAAGYRHYEVSNFARPGEECRHNWSYWNRSAYLGLGPSAHGFLPPIRSWNAFRWDRYEAAVRAGVGPLEGWERLGDADERLERIWLGLRTRRGVWEEAASGGHGFDEAVARCVAVGWLERREGWLVASLDGWLRLDSIVRELSA